LSAGRRRGALYHRACLSWALSTGFFGMNFGFMVNHISSLSTFHVLGIGTLLASCLILFAWFRRSGYV
jgi:Mg2+ and Co2+ transporter CorA